MSTILLRRTYEPLSRAAERTGLSVHDLRRCIAAGQLNAYRCGTRLIRLVSREVDWLRQQMTSPVLG